MPLPTTVSDATLPNNLHPLRSSHPASCAYRMDLSPHEWTWTQEEQQAMALALIQRDQQLSDLLTELEIRKR